MGNIVLLDDLTINKIAAGEVIERPASVVKELMENSIDAGATKITTEIKNGGITYIRITDDGKGILPDDMEIAFERHATSKIRSAKDLETVKSMGFRGEALASIAAIAHVEMTSKTADSELGYKIVIEGGNIISKEVVGCPKGTTIIVENLFYNTPVRYKFLKKDFTETGYVEDAVKRIALVNPNVSVKLLNLGKTSISTNGSGKIKDVIYSIYGKEIAENIIKVDYEFENMKVTGCVGNEKNSKSNRTNQLFFVNNRYVKDKTLSAATDQAFRGIIPQGKFGFVVLNIEIDPHNIDVNVHPAKLEIRFQEENKVFKLVYHGIKEAFEKEKSNYGKDKNSISEKENQKFLDIINNGTNYQNESKFGISGSSYNSVNSNSYNSNYNIHKENNFDNLNNSNYNISTESDTNVLHNQVQIDQDENSYISTENDNNVKENETIYEHENQNDANENWIEEIYKEKLKKERAQREGIIEENINDKSDSNLENELNNSFSENLVNSENTYNSEKNNVTQSDNSNNIKSEEKAENTENNAENSDNGENKEYKKELDENFEEMYRKTFGISISEKNSINNNVDNEITANELKSATNITNNSRNIKYKFVGIAFVDYIIVEINDELYIIDQVLAYEKILYEILINNFNDEHKRSSQMMLLPDIIELSPKQMDVARDNIHILNKSGFEIEEFGENTIKLCGVPSACMDLNTKDLFVEILDEINKVARTAKNEIVEKIIDTIAKEIARKSKKLSTFEEIDGLMKKLLNLNEPFVDYQNRSIAFRLSKSELDKKFFK